MCIISKPARVSGTKIFVALNAAQTRQLTVYANEVATASGAVMILPVPEPSTVRLIDMSGYTTIFEDLDSSFQKVTFSLTNSVRAYDGAKALPVVRVGGYLVTIVPSAGEFPYLSRETFGEVNASLASALATRYPRMGFVVCRLNAATTKYHPIAYEHTVESNELFVPTYHLHDHRGDFVEEPVAHWDHEIFSLNTVPALSDETSATSRLARAKISFAFPVEDALVKRTLIGNSGNRDIVLRPSIAPPPVASVCAVS